MLLRQRFSTMHGRWLSRFGFHRPVIVIWVEQNYNRRFSLRLESSLYRIAKFYVKKLLNKMCLLLNTNLNIVCRCGVLEAGKLRYVHMCYWERWRELILHESHRVSQIIIYVKHGVQYNNRSYSSFHIENTILLVQN